MLRGDPPPRRRLRASLIAIWTSQGRNGASGRNGPARARPCARVLGRVLGLHGRPGDQARCAERHRLMALEQLPISVLIARPGGVDQLLRVTGPRCSRSGSRAVCRASSIGLARATISPPVSHSPEYTSEGRSVPIHWNSRTAAGVIAPMAVLGSKSYLTAATAFLLVACGGSGHAPARSSLPSVGTRCVPAPIHRGPPPAWTAAAWTDSSRGFTCAVCARIR